MNIYGILPPKGDGPSFGYEYSCENVLPSQVCGTETHFGDMTEQDAWKNNMNIHNIV